MNYLNEVAAAMNLSKTTICKAINHSNDISYETRQRVLDFIAANYPDKLTDRTKGVSKKKSAKTILVIMPYKPRFFWDKAIEGMNEAVREFYTGKVTLKFAFYAGALNEEEVVSVLNDIELSSIDAVALVPVNSSAVAEKINSINDTIPVATFCERCDSSTPFLSVTSDGYREGCRIAEMISEGIDKSCEILVIHAEFYESVVTKQRIQGFRDRIGELFDKSYVIPCQCRVEYPDDVISKKGVRYLYNSILPSLFARTVSKKLEENPNIAAMYVPNGNIYALQIALKKIGREDISVFGHEFHEKSHQLFQSGLKGGYVDQNVKRQAYFVVQALASKMLKNEKRYPDVFITNFDSHFYH